MQYNRQNGRSLIAFCLHIINTFNTANHIFIIFNLEKDILYNFAVQK
jgi:hypothetical protein